MRFSELVYVAPLWERMPNRFAISPCCCYLVGHLRCATTNAAVDPRGTCSLTQFRRSYFRMRRHNQNGAGSVSYHTLRRAANQHVLESGPSMRRCNDKIGIAIFGERANLLDRRADLDRGFKFYAAKFRRAHELSHLSLGIFARSVFQSGEVVHGITIARVGIAEMNGMKGYQLRRNPIGELDRIIEPLQRTAGKIQRHENFVESLFTLPRNKHRTG